jgi:hypothetical protein
VTRWLGLRIAHDFLKRSGYRVVREVGAERFWSLQGLGFRWSLGSACYDAGAGEEVVGHACVIVSELSRTGVSMHVPPQRAFAFCRVCVPPEPFWKRFQRAGT